MTAYDPNKAAAYNKLRSQGLTEDQAANQAGISAAESGNYSIGSNGQMGPIVAGTGTVTQAPTAAQQAESARFQAGLQSDANFEQVDFAQTSRSKPGQTRPITYTTTSTETVSGGGTTSITAGARIATPASEAAGAAYAAKNAEYNDFIKNNPSDFTRRRQGLPPMTPEEKASYDQKINTLNREKEQLKNQQLNAEAGGAPTVTFTPNTTTTQTTTTTGTSVSPGAQNNLNTQTDPAVFNQTESQINSSVPTPSTAQAFPVADPPVITARTAAQPTAAPEPVGRDGVGVFSDPNDAPRVQPETQFNPEAQRRFTATATARTAEQAEALAIAQARAEAERELGSASLGVAFGPTSEVRISIQSNKDPGQPGFNRPNVPQETTYTATYTTSASVALVPPTQPLEIVTIAPPGGPPVVQAAEVPAEGDEAIAAFDRAQAAQPPAPPVTAAAPVLGTDLDNAQETPSFNGLDLPDPVATEGDEALAAFQRAQDAQDAAADIFASPPPVPTEGDEALAAFQRAQDAQDAAADFFATPPPVSTSSDPALGGGEASADTDAFLRGALAEANTNPAAARVQGLVNNAQNQSTLQARVNQPAAADWRVRLSLAVNADYLYKDPGGPGILAPLVPTDGVIFPYTPSIETVYKAKYNAYDLTHSNYRGYFYQNSSVDEITIKGTFTAQDTREAAYLLAVIHFFRSVTKMFYGQDKQAGAPPPVCFLTGLGQYQFREHPVLVQSFNYSLPTDVDYIRANGFNNIGLNMENRRNQSSGPSIGGALGTAVAIWNRLKNSGLSGGASTTDRTPSPPVLNQNVTNQSSINSTYVPTKMDISITLLPIQTRNQVSKQFSVKSFANGDLLKGGFW